MKILMIGHACSPRQGSEPSGTWNWAWQLSLRHEVFVLAYPHDRDGVETFLSQRPNPSLRFFWVPLPRSKDTYAAGAATQGYFSYLLWQSLAYKKAIELQKTIDFDIVHHVSYGSVSAPPPVQELGGSFIWGPIGGAQQAPASFRRYFGPAWNREIVRSARVHLLRFSPAVRRAARESVVTLATNLETASLLKRIGAQDVRLCLDSGIPPSFVSNARPYKSQGETFTLLWAGRMLRRKALPLALEALAEVPDVPLRLLIAGDGEMRESWEHCARSLRVESKVEFLGRIRWGDMPELYQRADAFLFTSLRDSFGTQVLEAMAQGLPILTLDHQGVATFVPADAGIKIPVTNPRETVRGIGEGIRWLAQNPEARRRLGQAGRAFTETQTWEKRAEWMSKLYGEVLSAQVSPRLGVPSSYGSYGVKKRMEKIDQTINLKGKRVLDVGCGNGCYTAELARRAEYVCGVDVQMPYLKAFGRLMSRVQAAGENLPFASGSFDIVTMIEVLEHTDCDSSVLEECFRILKPSGQLVLFVPNKLYPLESHPCHIGDSSIGPNIPLISWFPEFLRKRLCHARIYTRRKLFLMARSAGFRNCKSGYIFPPLDSFPLPFKESYRRAAHRLENSPLGRFGVSIYAVFQKPGLPTRTVHRVTPGFFPESASFEALGVRVNAVQIQEVAACMDEWIRDSGRCHSIAATSMHGIVEAQHDPAFKEILNCMDLVVPDGMPLVWLGRRRGHILPRRVYGPELLLAFCEKTNGLGYRHFFYGGEPGVAERLAESLKRRFPGMQVAGTFAPPFRRLSAEEDEEIVGMISHAVPDVLWVGLGVPKQERWMHEHRDRLRVPVQVGVGAAFDMLSGRRRQAPRWMREHGLEWLFRLFQEPRRLWRRYLIYGWQFVAYAAAESLGLRDFKACRETGTSLTSALSTAGQKDQEGHEPQLPAPSDPGQMQCNLP
jgi:exopolysaccharide biosynthesis WecB/TagA/CpsF family protein